MKKQKISIEKDRPIINILGEICWGFKVENFEKKINSTQANVESLLNRLLKDEKNGVTFSYITDTEIEIIKKALEEVEKEIEEWEFGLRIGASLEEVKNIPIFKE